MIRRLCPGSAPERLRGAYPGGVGFANPQAWWRFLSAPLHGNLQATLAWVEPEQSHQ